MVVLIVPRNEKEKTQLEKNLRVMDCHGLLMKLWRHKYDERAHSEEVERVELKSTLRTKLVDS